MNNGQENVSAGALYLTSENARFAYADGIVSLVLNTDGEEKAFSRILLSRAFPFDMPWEFISVTDAHGKEIGMIRTLSLFSEDTEAMLKKELERIYYTPKIRAILSLKERYGFSYWEAVTDEGSVRFTLQDTFRSLLRIGEDRLAIFDVDGNRFEIESIAALDKKSYRKIELYL